MNWLPVIPEAMAALRSDAEACLQAAIAAVEPERLVRRYLTAHSQAVSAAGRVRLAAIGKAAAAMARGAASVLGDRIGGGVLVTAAGLEEAAPAGLELVCGSHPVPDEGSVAGGRAVLELAARLGPDEQLLCLVSGGGSALATVPPDGVSLEAVQATTDALLRAGATIGELNAVRKHLDRLKGGRLARAAAPAPLLALVLSDVVGDPLDVIASGPVSPDPTTFAEAVEVLRRRGVWEQAPEAVRSHLERGLRGEEPESPKPGDACFDGVTVEIVGSNRMAAAAALAAAEGRGYSGRLLSTTLTGEAREAGRRLAAAALELRRVARPRELPVCLVAAGETTVTVTGAGRGGRNQELALGAALALAGSEGILVASAGTDGIDGPTDAAGALADGSTVARAAARGLDPERALRENDAYPFFQALGDLIVTGPTGTNVMDVQVVFVT